MNTILSTLFMVLATWFVISRFLPVKGVQNISGKKLKNIVEKGETTYRCSYSR